MSQYLAKKYASVVDRETIHQLYQKYEEYQKSTRSDSAKDIKLARKTLTRIIHSELPISTATKEKILMRSLKLMPHFTVGFLTRRLYDSTTESLQIYLGQIYEELFDSSDKKQYSELLQQYYNTLEGFKGLIHDNIETEAADMVSQIIFDAKRKKFQISSPSYFLELKQSENRSSFKTSGTTKTNTPQVPIISVRSLTGLDAA